MEPRRARGSVLGVRAGVQALTSAASGAAVLAVAGVVSMYRAITMTATASIRIDVLTIAPYPAASRICPPIRAPTAIDALKAALLSAVPSSTTSLASVPTKDWIVTEAAPANSPQIVTTASALAGSRTTSSSPSRETSIPVTMVSTPAGAERRMIALTALVITAQFITYSFISPLLIDRAEVPLGQISLMLMKL